jgi:XapX domain-containing protein
MGVAVGVAYGLAGIRSPAPPLIALAGLLGIVLGEHAGHLTKRHVLPISTIVIQRTIGAVQKSR